MSGESANRAPKNGDGFIRKKPPAPAPPKNLWCTIGIGGTLCKVGRTFPAQIGTNLMPEDKKALVERLFNAHRNALVAFFQGRVRVRADAPDLAQEVYLRMMRLRSLEAIENPEGYLFTVASNLAKEHWARQRRHGTPVDTDDASVEIELAELPTADAQLDADQRSRRLAVVLRELSPKCQAVVVLQYVHGCSYVEIGEKLQISPRMVKKYLAQALELCRRRMRRLG